MKILENHTAKIIYSPENLVFPDINYQNLPERTIKKGWNLGDPIISKNPKIREFSW
jgi:hypothetical protein